MPGLDEARNKLALANRMLAHEGVLMASAMSACAIRLIPDAICWRAPAARN
jgi:hypothetical protein